ASIVSSASRWIARMESESGQVLRAVQWMEECLRAAQRSVEEESTPRSIQELITARVSLARSLKLAGELTGGSELVEKANGEGDRLYQSNPRNPDSRLAVIASYFGAGSEHAVPPDLMARIVPTDAVGKAVDFTRTVAVEEATTNYWQTWLVMAYLQQSYVAV